MRRRAQRSALACRRSTAALAAASERRSSVPERASWDAAARMVRKSGNRFSEKDHTPAKKLSGRYPPPPVPVQRPASQTGRHAGRAFSRNRPGAKVTSPRPREPLPPPAGRVTGRCSLWARFGKCCNRNRDGCQAGDYAGVDKSPQAWQYPPTLRLEGKRPCQNARNRSRR